MFTFIIIKPMTKFGFRFPNQGYMQPNFATTIFNIGLS